MQRKKNVKELTESRAKVGKISNSLIDRGALTLRLKNIVFLSNLTKFGIVPPHLILYMFKVCLDNFTGSNVENIAWLLEGCGRYLLRSDGTHEPFAKMVRIGFVLVHSTTEPFAAGVDEEKTSHAAFRPKAEPPPGERLLSGEQR